MAEKRLAVVAHAGKKLGGGLGELRRLLAQAGHPAPIRYEVSKSRKAPKAVRRAVKKGARLIFIWGRDGMVQHCVDALAGTKKVEIAIVPAGTANLWRPISAFRGRSRAPSPSGFAALDAASTSAS